nr:EthD domain-containing protein [Cardiobacterium sp. Marseille-Q4385]
MFKIIMLVKKRAELSTEEFLACWREHSAKVLRYQAALGIRGYTKTLPEVADTLRGTQPFAYDAMGELWYDSCDVSSAPATRPMDRRHLPNCARMNCASLI